MATVVIDAALQEFASTLDVSKAPSTMSCPKCPRLLINAYKGSCCDTSICEICFAEANNACPQCSHTPYNVDTVKPSSNARKSVKSWLKEQKAKAEAQTTAVNNTELAIVQPVVDGAQDAVVNGHDAESSVNDEPSIESEVVAEVAIPSIENQDDAGEPQSDQIEAGDDDVEFQVELDQDDPDYVPPHIPEQDENNYNDIEYTIKSRETNTERTQSASHGYHHQGSNADEGSSQNMDLMNPMLYMQQMQQMMQTQNGFSSMMNMPMGMNSMGNMFGGANGGMNGMNMMNFIPQNMFGASQNMWQNNNANAFPNGMGGDFNPGFQSNFNRQQQYSNGDFQQSGYRGRGYGRGRGRGRGGHARGRGNLFNNYDNNHNNFQTRDQRFQGQQPVTNGHQPPRQEVSKPQTFLIDDHNIDDDEFAPGGQEEVQEALGEDYAKKSIIEEHAQAPEPEQPAMVQDDEDAANKPEDLEPPEQIDPTPAPIEDNKPVAEAYTEDLDMAMAPPSAPSGPSRSHDKDFGFRARGQGRFSRNRASTHLSNGHPASPVKSISGVSVPQSEGPGVAGAPTGPRAMREPPPPARKPSTGFQIIGRASLASRTSERRTPSPGDHEDDNGSRRDSRKFEEDDHNRRSSHRRSKYDQNGDHEMRDDKDSHSRSNSHDRSRKSRRDRDKYESRTLKHDRRGDRAHDDDKYKEVVDDDDRSHRRDRKHHDRDRERDRDRDREREKDEARDRERDRDRDRDRTERDREREDRHREKDRDRKRRRDREAEEDQDDEYDSSRHKSRRHRKEHTSASGRNEDTSGTTRSSHRSSQVPEPSNAKEDDVDPITRERMERDRQRMMKEQQRRDNAAAALKGGTPRSGGQPRRQMSFKYEDEAERGIIEGERERNRARWR